ncbi:hypothetical protein ACYSNW_00310 [Enterococcus sp. LJL99]
MEFDSWMPDRNSYQVIDISNELSSEKDLTKLKQAMAAIFAGSPTNDI